MDARELRIGNWVQSFEFGWPMQFKSFHGLSNIESKPYDFEPIKITKEWLVRFGFYSRPMSYCISITDLPKHELKEICIDLNQGIYIRQGSLKQKRDEDDLVLIWSIDMKGVIYVHQLQNLYYALTGKELTLLNNK
jgi:hypothetical protein